MLTNGLPVSRTCNIWLSKPTQYKFLIYTDKVHLEFSFAPLKLEGSLRRWSLLNFEKKEKGGGKEAILKEKSKQTNKRNKQT